MIIGGVVLLIAMILVFKQDRNSSAPPSASTDERPAAQLDQALAENRPTLAFFHSTTCKQCIVMMDTIVGQVYPEFSTSVVLVDVNVYDENNTALLQRVGLHYIPTLIFYDRTGKGQVSVGVLEADQLRQRLADLGAGE